MEYLKNESIEQIESNKNPMNCYEGHDLVPEKGWKRKEEDNVTGSCKYDYVNSL